VRSPFWLPLLLSILVLPACAGHRSAQLPSPAAEPRIVTVAAPARDARGSIRFHMTQSGQRMTADQFDAWMKRNGIRVATGKPSKSRR